MPNLVELTREELEQSCLLASDIRDAIDPILKDKKSIVGFSAIMLTILMALKEGKDMDHKSIMLAASSILMMLNSAMDFDRKLN